MRIKVRRKLHILVSLATVFFLMFVATAIAQIYLREKAPDKNLMHSSSPLAITNADPLLHYSWPMFRHNLNRTGYTDSPAPDNNQTMWTYQTGGPVYSSPAVVDGKVYVGSDDGYVYCLNVTTTTLNGVLIWKYKTGGAVRSSPTVVDGILLSYLTQVKLLS